MERRSDRERHEILGELSGEVTILQPMRVLEISMGGAQLELGVPLTIESLHDFRLGLAEHAVIVKGRVVHCRISEIEPDRVVYRAGIEFIQPSHHALEALRAFIQTLKTSKGDG
jgi:hypothetical protein